jgi:hypothetical protein
VPVLAPPAPRAAPARAAPTGVPGVPTVAAARRHLGPGELLPRHAAERFSAAFHHDLSQVRVHAGNTFVARSGAAALTTGGDIAFAPGRYRPGSPAGDELLGHELAHVVQQGGGSSERVQASGLSRSATEAEADRAARAVHAGAPVPPLSSVGTHVQLREFGPAEDPSSMRDGDWTFGDRLTNSPRWQAACRHNLLNLRSGEYTQIAERTAFYWWFYNEVAAMGHEIRWPLAAAVVAGGANELANRDPAGIDFMRNNQVEALLRRGNQVIFDDVLPKLRELYLGPVRTGAEALAWDSQVLIEEQNLIQPLYAGLDPADVDAIESAARQEGLFATVGTAVFGGPSSGPHHVGGAPPPLPASLNIRVPEDRWRYGMMLAHYYSPGSAQDAAASLAWAMSLTPPTPGAGYTDGSKLAEVDRYAGLHAVTAQISSVDMDRDEVRRAIQALSPHERAVLARDEWYVAMLRHRHGMSRAQAVALLTSEDIAGCPLLRVIGHVEGTGTYTEADNIVVMLRPGASWTPHGGTRRVQVQAVSAPAYSAFTGVPLRWVWEDSLHCYSTTTPDPVPVPPPVVTSYPVYYDTGGADLENDSNAAANIATLNDLLERIRTLRAEPSVDRIELRFVGQASPRWESERTSAGKFARNLDLSLRRAQNAEDYVSAAFTLFGGPVPIVVVGPIAGSAPFFAPSPADESSRLGLGSMPGLLQSWDTSNDDQRFRRTDVVLRVTFRRP